MHLSAGEIIEPWEIDRVHGNANFGKQSKRSVVNEAVLKIASGYHIGATATHILHDHGLIKSRYGKGCRTLTKKGRQYLFAAFKNQTNS